MLTMLGEGRRGGLVLEEGVCVYRGGRQKGPSSWASRKGGKGMGGLGCVRSHRMRGVGCGGGD